MTNNELVEILLKEPNQMAKAKYVKVVRCENCVHKDAKLFACTSRDYCSYGLEKNNK